MREMQELERRIKAQMAKIKHKLAILSGKGGVGKSTIAANLAVGLAQREYKVGILDADIHGPSIPKILDLESQETTVGLNGILPLAGPFETKVFSIEFLLDNKETPVIWRGPLKMRALQQFLADVDWGELDYFIVDLPPGTGDEPLSIMQLIPGISGVVIVTAPSEVSQIVVKKAITFVRTVNVPLIGVIENMSGFVCPNCSSEFNILGAGGGKKISEEMDVRFLGKIPIDPSVCEDSDRGIPFIVEHCFLREKILREGRTVSGGSAIEGTCRGGVSKEKEFEALPEVKRA